MTLVYGRDETRHISGTTDGGGAVWVCKKGICMITVTNRHPSRVIWKSKTGIFVKHEFHGKRVETWIDNTQIKETLKV